tara:strand:- start:1089 stop:2177 length:1089 start_codon:yes stop_codon:yes gene_type:complete
VQGYNILLSMHGTLNLCVSPLVVQLPRAFGIAETCAETCRRDRTTARPRPRIARDGAEQREASGVVHRVRDIYRRWRDLRRHEHDCWPCAAARASEPGHSPTLTRAHAHALSDPFDTVKTKMQAQASFIGTSGGQGSMAGTISRIATDDGAVGFYRGCIPPMWGSAVYRSAQFAVYDLLFNHLSSDLWKQRVDPLGVGSEMELRVPVAGFVGATSRTVLEQPIEYAKVKGQTGQVWKLGEIYQGAGLQWARTGPMMTLYFCLFDMCKRNGLTSSALGQFFSSGGCALVGFWIVWPFETLKNQTQAGMPGTVIEKVRGMPGGFLGLYRGILPGSLSVFLRNGAAMIVMQLANRKISEWGLRGN